MCFNNIFHQLYIRPLHVNNPTFLLQQTLKLFRHNVSIEVKLRRPTKSKRNSF